MTNTFIQVNQNLIMEVQKFIKQYASNISINQRHLIAFNELYSSFAISKAEKSEITLQEAQQIQKQELSHFGKTIADEIRQLDTTDKKHKSKLQKLHDKLEYANILASYRYIQTDEFASIWKEKSFVDILQILHSKLTQDIDGLFTNTLPDYHPYHSGTLRNSNDIFIGINKPLPYLQIHENLTELGKKVRNCSSLDEIFVIHAMLYQTHPFNNGNKRLCRILETILLQNIGIYPQIIPVSLGYYLQQERYIRQVANNIIQNKNFDGFVSFGYGSLILGALYVLVRKLNALRYEFVDRYAKDSVLVRFFAEGEMMKTKDLLIKYIKKTKLSEQNFYKQLQKEKSIFGDFLLSKNIGKNTYYWLDIQDINYKIIYTKIVELLEIYKLENQSYKQIDFIRHY